MTRAAKHHAAFGLHLAMSLFLFWSWGCSEVNGAAGDADAHADPDADAPWDLDLLAEIDGDGHPCDPCGGEWDLPSDIQWEEMPPCATASDQAVTSPVDIIIGIDQSPSMGEEIQGVIDNLNTNLVSILAAANLDYRVIFVAGVAGLPTGPGFYQCSAAVNSSDMLTLLLWTYDGDYKGPNTCNRIEGTVEAWRDWLRLASFKVFIALTDDDPSSFNCAYAASTCTDTCGGCAGDCAGWCPMFQCPTYADRPAEWGGEDFAAELYKLLPAGMFGTPEEPWWVFHSIVPVTRQLAPGEPVTPLTEVCSYSGNTGETSGVEYQKLSRLTGGIRFPSCDTDYSPVFETIAGTILPLACKFNLENTDLGTPDPARTNVMIDFNDGLGPRTIPMDSTAPCDGGADGWQWEVEGEVVVLCGQACEDLKSSPEAVVTITLGCQTVVI